MTLPRPARQPLLVWALLGGGVAYFVSTIASAYADARTPALAAIAAALLVYVARRVDAAWLISAGIAASMFSGNWWFFGFGGTVVPDRLLIATGILAVLLRIGPSRDRPPIELQRVHFALAAALAYAAVSMVIVQSTSHTAVFALIDQYGAMPFLVFTVAPVAFHTERQRQILLGSLVATGAYLSLTALFEKLHLTQLIVPSYINDPAVGTHFGRARGPFAEAVANGLALYACAVAAAIAFAVWRRPLLRAFAACVAVLCLVGVQLTVTRAVWLGAVVATAFVLVAAPQLRRYLVPTLAAGLCLVLAAFAVIPGLAGQAQDRQADKSPIWERKNSDAAAFRMIAAKPLVGFGWYEHNAKSESYFRMSPTFPLSGESAGLHNLFLTYAVGLGLVGFGLWLLAVALALGGAVRRRAPPAIEPWRIGLGAIVACYIVAGIAGPLEYLYPTLLVWTWAGVAFQGRPRPAERAVPSAGALGRDHLQRVPREAA